MVARSTVYNQTGQSFVEQLALHRTMCKHFQRILSAKKVVDTRNPKYEQTVRRRCCTRPSSCQRLRFSDRSPSVGTIDRVGFDPDQKSEVRKIQFYTQLCIIKKSTPVSSTIKKKKMCNFLIAE